MPPKPIRSLRNLTRYRTTQIQERQREANRLHKILEDTGIKLDCVASDILGVSGRLMLDALVSDTTDPEVLTDLARGRLRSKLAALKEALEGRFTPEHALIVGHILAHLDFLDEAITSLGEAIEAELRPFAAQAELLQTIPGVGRRTAEVLIAEIGVETAQFASAQRLASWAGICPGNDQSAGKRRSGRTTKGSKWLRRTLIESALAATRSKDTHLASQYRRLKARRGHHRAIVAVAHSILTAAFHMLTTGEVHREPGPHHSKPTTPTPTSANSSENWRPLRQQVTLEPIAA